MPSNEVFTILGFNDLFLVTRIEIKKKKTIWRVVHSIDLINGMHTYELKKSDGGKCGTVAEHSPCSNISFYA